MSLIDLLERKVDEWSFIVKGVSSLVFPEDTTSMGRMIFSQLAYTPIPLDLSDTQLHDLFKFCGVDLYSSSSPRKDAIASIAPIGILSLHNYPLRTITNLVPILPAISELTIPTYIPHFYEALVILVENRNNLLNLKELKILNNRITRKEVRQLTALLESLNQLEVLVLDNCGLYDYDIDALLPTVSWKTITHLSLNRNRLTARAFESILTLVRDRCKCAPPSLFLQDIDTVSTSATIQTLRPFTNSSALYSEQSALRVFRLPCRQSYLQKTLSIVRGHIYIDLSRFEASDAIAPDLGLFIYEWLRMATICHGGVSQATICINGRVTSSIRGISSALSTYGLYLLCHRSFNELGLSISLDCSNCSLEFDVKKLQLPPNAISHLMNRLKINLSASLIALSVSDCDLSERWKRQDMQAFISFLHCCKHLKRLDLRYNEFNKEFNTLFCKELESTDFLPYLDTLEADMFLDLHTLSISLQKRYSAYVARYLDDGDSMFKGLARGPVVLSCGSQTRGNKAPSALMRMLSLDGSLVLSALTQNSKYFPFDSHATTLHKILGDVLCSPLKSLTLRQSISPGALLKPVCLTLWQYTDGLILSEAMKGMITENDAYCNALSTQAAILVRVEIMRIARCNHLSNRMYMQEVDYSSLTLASFLEMMHRKDVATFTLQLLHLDLSHNSLKKADVQELITMIPLIPTLQALILSDCSLSDRVCATILESLPTLLEQTNLWYIDISENMLGSLTEQAFSAFLQRCPVVLQRQLTLNLRLRSGNTHVYAPQAFLSATNNIMEDIKIIIWLIMSKDSISSFSASDIENLKRRGVNIISVVSPVGRFYDHKYSSAASHLLRELGLPDHSFHWDSLKNLYEHFMYNCA